MRRRTAARTLVALALLGSIAAAGCQPAASRVGTLASVAEARSSAGATFTPAITSAPAATDAEKARAASAINQFGLDLLRATERQTAPGQPNTVMSPLSVHIALAMASDGAVGQTRDQMRGAMGVDDADDAAYRATIASIWNADQGQLQLADSVWTQNGFPVRRSYGDLMQAHFAAEATSTDFASPDGPAAVNDWVARRTNGLITKAMGGPDPALRVLLLNTAHFLAKWKTPFQPDETRLAAFHLATGKTVQVPTMHAESDFAQIGTANADVIELPYEGGHTSMLVFLPKSGVGVDSLLASMTAQSVRDAETSITATKTWDVAVSLPKLTKTWSSDLVSPLESLGIRQAFLPGQADFSAMSASKPLWIGFVTHMTYLDVNEHSTEAAAATGFGAHGGYPPPPPQFDVDRPYVMALVDKPTGTMLFIAAIRDPSR